MKLKQTLYRHRLGLLLTIVLLTLVVLISIVVHQLRLKPIASTLQRDQPGLYSIDHFVDGDTIAVKMNGSVEKVRFIGVDTPETHKPNTPVECYGPQAAAFTQAEIGHQKVRLVSDSLSTDRDRYNRLLRYVYLIDGTDLNELLIQSGHGFYYPYFPFTKSTVFSADEQQAITAKKGLWGACTPTPSDSGGYIMKELAK